MSEHILIWILIIHFLADFGLQTHEQSQNKSKGNNIWNLALFQHVGVYSLVWCISLIGYLPYHAILMFGFITFTAHYTTDWITSRVGKSFWVKEDLHNGFVVIGFDQMLHYLQLYFTLKLLLP